MSPDSEPQSNDELGKNVTIYQVAARAGVSIATVSHALNRPERVAVATRRRVEQTVEELGFVARGRGRARRTLRRVAVIGPFTLYPTYLPRLLGLLDAAVPLVDVVVVDDSGSGRPTIDAVPVHGRIDGLVVMGSEPTAELEEQLAEKGVPTVLLDCPSRRFTSVTVDDESGGRLVADHLLGCGATSFAWVSPEPPPSEYVSNGELRLKGFTAGLRAAGVSEEVRWTICEDSFGGGLGAAEDLVAGPQPDAVFALHDTIAAGLVAGLRERGVQVPQDVRIVGYDDTEAAQFYDLTTIRQPFRESGSTALEALHRLHADPDLPLAHVTLMPQLVVRGSSPEEGPTARD